MTARRPPVAARWLMERFNVGQDLVGDLIERHARGRSSVWFWRQALLAVVMGSARDIVRHKVLFARAIVVGVIANNVLAAVSFEVLSFLMRANYALSSRVPMLPLLITARFRHPSVLLLVAALIFAGTGWVVGRLHRPYGAVMALGLVAIGWLYSSPELFRTVANGLQHSRFWPYTEGWMIATMLQSFALLAGGLIGARTSARDPRPKDPAYNLRP